MLKVHGEEDARLKAFFNTAINEHHLHTNRSRNYPVSRLRQQEVQNVTQSESG